MGKQTVPDADRGGKQNVVEGDKMQSDSSHFVLDQQDKKTRTHRSLKNASEIFEVVSQLRFVRE